MSREVRHDGSGAFNVRFPFDRDLVDLIKSLPNRRWNAGERFWWVPEQDAVQLVELLVSHRFGFDSGTLRVYGKLGGSLALEAQDTFEIPKPRMPGLFDGEQAPGTDVLTAAGSDEFTVSGLNERVKQVLEDAFPRSVWLVAEISVLHTLKFLAQEFCILDSGGTEVAHLLP